eukprot:scaffold6815_cov30-Cyclotella_meneghiniana.AAC.2
MLCCEEGGNAGLQSHLTVGCVDRAPKKQGKMNVPPSLASLASKKHHSHSHPLALALAPTRTRSHPLAPTRTRSHLLAITRTHSHLLAPLALSLAPNSLLPFTEIET